MNIETLKQTIDSIETKMENLKVMIEDFNACKSETSKKVLEATIMKLAKSLETLTSTTEAQHTA